MKCEVSRGTTSHASGAEVSRPDVICAAMYDDRLMCGWCSEYLAPGATDPVNVDSRVAETVRRSIEHQMDRYCLDEAEVGLYFYCYRPTVSTVEYCTTIIVIISRSLSIYTVADPCPPPVGGLKFFFASILILLLSRLHTMSRGNTKVVVCRKFLPSNRLLLSLCCALHAGCSSKFCKPKSSVSCLYNR